MTELRAAGWELAPTPPRAFGHPGSGSTASVDFSGA